MGADESRIKGPPSEEVTAFMNTFHKLCPRDQLHVLQLLDDDELELRAKYAYFNVDIPYDEWNLFAEANTRWERSLKYIERWKTIRPHIKGFSIRKGEKAALAICFTPEHVQYPFTEQIWEMILEGAPKYEYNIMVEANGCIKLLSDFLQEGPDTYNPNDSWTHVRTIDSWLNPGSETVESILDDLKDLRTWEEEDDEEDDEDEGDDDDEEEENDEPTLLSKWEQDRLDNWNVFVASLQ